MGCACKVNQQIENINKIYGNGKISQKTNIKELFSSILYRVIIYILYILFFPIIIIYLLFRKFITNRPISLDSFIKHKKNVRNK